MAFQATTSNNVNRNTNLPSHTIISNNIQNTEFKNKLKEKIYANYNDFSFLSQQMTKSLNCNEVRFNMIIIAKI